MIHGSDTSTTNYPASHCAANYSAASGGAFDDQLHAALAQIAADGANNVKVITIDIGANDAQGQQTGANGPECDGQNGTSNGVIDFGPMVAGQAADGTQGWGPPVLNQACLTNGAQTVAANLPNDHEPAAQRRAARADPRDDLLRSLPLGVRRGRTRLRWRPLRRPVRDLR